MVIKVVSRWCIYHIVIMYVKKQLTTYFVFDPFVEDICLINNQPCSVLVKVVVGVGLDSNSLLKLFSGEVVTTHSVMLGNVYGNRLHPVCHGLRFGHTRV